MFRHLAAGRIQLRSVSPLVVYLHRTYTDLKGKYSQPHVKGDLEKRNKSFQSLGLLAERSVVGLLLFKKQEVADNRHFFGFENCFWGFQ